MIEKLANFYTLSDLIQPLHLAHRSNIDRDEETGELVISSYSPLMQITGMLSAIFFGILFAVLSSGPPIFGLFMASATFGGGLGMYSVMRLFKSELQDLKNRSEPPHEVIEDFIKWEEGDEIELGHFKGRYEGVLNDKSILLETEIRTYTKFPPVYVARYLKRNKHLRRRISKQQNKKLKNSLSDSDYEEFMDEVREQYQEKNLTK